MTVSKRGQRLTCYESNTAWKNDGHSKIVGSEVSNLNNQNLTLYTDASA